MFVRASVYLLCTTFQAFGSFVLSEVQVETMITPVLINVYIQAAFDVTMSFQPTQFPDLTSPSQRIQRMSQPKSPGFPSREKTKLLTASSHQLPQHTSKKAYLSDSDLVVKQILNFSEATISLYSKPERLEQHYSRWSAANTFQN